MKRLARTGMIMGITIIVVVLLLVMGTAVATMGTGNLNSALVQLHSERAYQVAEAGIELAINDIRREGNNCSLTLHNVGIRSYTLHNGDLARVTVYTRRQSDATSPSDSPVQIPKGFCYLVSEGQALSDSKILGEKSAGAMCQIGHSPRGLSQAFQVVDQFSAINLDLISAMDLASSTELPGRLLLSTRAGTPNSLGFELKDNAINVNGNIGVPSGTDFNSFSQKGHHFLNGGSFQTVTPSSIQKKIEQPLLAPQVQPDQSFRGILPSGHYSALEISNSVELSGEYLVDTLNTKPGARLVVSASNAAELYVKNWIQTSHEPVFGNGSSANHLRVYYSPPDKSPALSLTLDEQPLSLVAPTAKLHLTLKSPNAFGSIYANSLVIESAVKGRKSSFYYDPLAAQPVQHNLAETSTNPQIRPEIGIPEFRPVFVTGRQRF